MYGLDYTLRWQEPFGGWGNHSDFYKSKYQKILDNNDTGLCNRIFHWEIAYDLNKRHDFKYTILLPYRFWPEIELINLPYTKPVFYGEYEFGSNYIVEYESLNFKTVFDIESDDVYKATQIDRDYIQQLYLDETKKLKDNHYYSDFSYYSLRELVELKNPQFLYHLPDVSLKYRPLSSIKLKHKFMDDVITNFTKNAIGFHIRRNNGVSFNEDSIYKNNPQLKKEFLSIRKTSHIQNPLYQFVDDEKYFKIIDKILKILPDHDIFISMDLPKQFLEPYYKNFGNMIFSSHDILPEIKNYLLESKINVERLENYANAILNVTDLFCLSNCNYLVCSYPSTYSEFAYEYKNTPYSSIKLEVDDIVSDFLKHKNVKFNKNKKLF
jgi:hypothetical protein